MIMIREIVQTAIQTGCLTIEAEDQLRQQLRTRYDDQDLKAFMLLQRATMAGSVKQESRELALRDRALTKVVDHN